MPSSSGIAMTASHRIRDSSVVHVARRVEPVHGKATALKPEEMRRRH